MSNVARPPVTIVVGSGSAGRRHAAMIHAVAPDERLVVVRRPESRQPIDDLVALGVELLTTVDDAAALGPRLAVVAAPAPVHAPAAVAFLRSGATVLVEKPLAASMADGLAIRAAAAASDGEVVVGYHLRFDDIARRFAALVSTGVAPVDAFDLRVGQHLGQWRPTVPAERSVSARRELGGGVLLELSHEIDAVLELFGPVCSVRAALRTDGAPTDGTVETVADLELEMASGATGRVHLDMVSDPPFRTWVAQGGGATVCADLLAGRITIDDADGRAVARVEPGWRDRAERALIEHARAVAAGDEPPACGIADGLAVLAVIDAARASAASGRAEPVVAVAPAMGRPSAPVRG